MSQVTDPVMLDTTGQDIVSKLQDVIAAINGGSIDPLTVTQNGTYTPSGATLGYGPVTVNVQGGGGDVPLLTRAQWDALSTAQKQAYGLLAIQDADSGFTRGELVYGADYIPIGVYLPASNTSDIICEAYVDNFTSGVDTWGAGSNPIILQSGLSPVKDASENAVYLGIAANDKYAYVDFGAVKATYTAYAVMKLVSPGAYTRLLSSMASRSSGQGMLLYGGTISVSSWANDTSTGVLSTSYVAVALQYQLGSGAGLATSAGTYITKSPSNSSQYLTIGRTDIGPTTGNAEPGNLYMRYFAVSGAYETEQQIRTNLANLESVFIP